MAARVHQSAIVVLPVKFDQCRRQRAQQPRAHRLVVDERLAPAVGLDLAADHQRLARIERDVCLVERLRDHFGQARELEARGHACALLAAAHQHRLRTIAQHEAERIEQDRLARAGFAGQHAEPAAEVEIERLDQHHVADGKSGQHSRAFLAQGSAPVSGQWRAVHRGTRLTLV